MGMYTGYRYHFEIGAKLPDVMERVLKSVTDHTYEDND